MKSVNNLRKSRVADSSNQSGLNKSTGWVMKLCSTWSYVLQKVPFGGLSECERTYYGLMGRQRHFTVISACSQQTNTPQKASSPRSNRIWRDAVQFSLNRDSEQFWGTNYPEWWKWTQWHYKITLILKNRKIKSIWKNVFLFPKYSLNSIKWLDSNIRSSVKWVLYIMIKRWWDFSVLLPEPLIPHKLLEG